MPTFERGSRRRERPSGGRAAAAPGAAPLQPPFGGYQGACRRRRSHRISSLVIFASDGLLIALNKPFGVICKFSPEAGRRTLADYVAVRDVYPAGRLDTDSEGLLLLTDDGALQARIAHPRHKLAKTYWTQVEGAPTDEAIAKLRAGIDLGDFVTKPAGARRIDGPPGPWPRAPPVRPRARIPTAWLELTLREGKNRQVRRMTARVGFPTLRLIRAAIGNIDLSGLAPGEWREADAENLS